MTDDKRPLARPWRWSILYGNGRAWHRPNAHAARPSYFDKKAQALHYETICGLKDQAVDDREIVYGLPKCKKCERRLAALAAKETST